MEILLARKIQQKIEILVLWKAPDRIADMYIFVTELPSAYIDMLDIY